MINIAELLRNVAKDTELYSPICGHCKLNSILYDDSIRVIAHEVPFRFDKYGRFYSACDTECLLFPSKDCKTWEGWKVPAEPKFQVGEWIVQNDNGTVSQITKIINEKDEYGEYRAYEHTNVYFHTCFENEYHLWTIKDAKDGDILSAKIDGDDYILLFKQIKNGWIETYGHYYITIDKFCAPTQLFCRDYQGTLHPATQEQCKTLFKKMRDDGYKWDPDKKVLTNRNKPHYDISNFHAGMPVLVREYDTCHWQWVLYSHFNGVGLFFAAGKTWRQCIPYEGNESLIGTVKQCDEQYINW